MGQHVFGGISCLGGALCCPNAATQTHRGTFVGLLSTCLLSGRLPFHVRSKTTRLNAVRLYSCHRVLTSMRARRRMVLLIFDHRFDRVHSSHLYNALRLVNEDADDRQRYSCLGARSRWRHAASTTLPLCMRWGSILVVYSCIRL